ncbi:sensor histidine kinase [Fusibacter bizertensis]|uniref:Sensor histidine kinase n=1 Tax=Fusibacter bizertensis TaxID=1488331 RepID=A0ABT6N8R8_9FIRM|nr:sensor histidine kinase [Fusibacter bizertensis]MDH8676810.1 sensor histidine kinase [Fusibacter bizertensis]
MKLRDLSIKRKIVYLYLPIAIVPMLFFAVVSMKIYESAFINRSLESMEDNNVLISNRIDSILSDAEGSATYLTLSINRILNSNEFAGVLRNDIKLYNLISNELTYAKLIYKQIDSIAFIDKDNRLYYSDYSLQKGKMGILVSPMLTKLKKTTGNSVWFELKARDYITTDPDRKMLTVGKKIWNINSGETIGYLFVNVSESVFTSLFEEQVASYSIYDSENQMLLTSSLNKSEVSNINQFLLEVDHSSKIIKTETNRILVSKTQIDKLKWRLLSEADLDLFTQDLSNIILLVIILLITIISLEITMTLTLNRLITSPILKLKKGAEEISKGNFKFKFNMKTNDEIGLLAQSFNDMSDQVNQLLNDVEREEHKKREYELALIQQQIKPHFLYNTLDIILKLSQMGQARKAQMVTRKLAEYYRNSLSGGADIVSIKNEIKMTEDYLELQKLRYSDVFDYDIMISEKICKVAIPKLSLQPIVENAIEHGFVDKQVKGSIKIYDRISEVEGKIEIIVEDNGAGIDQEKLLGLNQLMDNTKPSSEIIEVKSFGLRNVNHRLKLFFGEDSGIKIETKNGVYTRIIIRLCQEVEVDTND